MAKVVFTEQPQSPDAPYVYGTSENVTPLTVKTTVLGKEDTSVTYQWYYNITDSSEGGTWIEGATNASYTPATDISGTRYYYVVASKREGIGFTSTTSSTAKVSVTYPLKANVAADDESASKVYDGNNKFSDVVLNVDADGLQGGDTVTAKADGTAADNANTGTHTFIVDADTIELKVTHDPALTEGADRYYSLAPGDVSGNVTISQKPLNADMIAEIDEQTYTGTPITPDITVTDITDGNVDIITPDDYTVSYVNNIKAAESTAGADSAPTATITAAENGNYSGSAGKTFTIVKTGSTVGAPAISSDNITYGDTFTVTFTPGLSSAAANYRSRAAAPARNTPAKTAKLYVDDTEIAAVNDVTENTLVTFTVDTVDKKIPASEFDETQKTFTIRWSGDDNLDASEGTVTAVLSKKALTGEVNSSDNSAQKTYDGGSQFKEVALTLPDVVPDDAVSATANGTAADANVGTEKAFTASNVTLTGDHKDYYTLVPGDVGGTVKITVNDVTTSGKNDNHVIAETYGTFPESVFDGVNGEKVTGTFAYGYAGETDYCYDEVAKELAKLKKGAQAEVDFTFTADGNYTGTITGTLSMTVAGLEFSSTGAVAPAADPVYGSGWNTVLAYDPGKLSATLNGAPVSGTYALTVGGAAYDGAAVPKAGNHHYKLTFTSADRHFMDVEVLSGSVTVAQREAQLSWTDTVLTYDGNAKKPTALVENKVAGDDVAVTVAGEQTGVGDGYPAMASGLTGADAANYILPAATTVPFKIQPAAPSGEVTISGDDANGNQKLDSGDTVTAGISGVTPAGGTASYQWKKTADGTAIHIGTNEDTYTLTADDRGGTIFCVVTFSGNVTGEKESSRLDIAKEPLRGTIAISGTATVGSVLTVSAPANTGIAAADYTAVWYRDRAAVAGATGTGYTLTKADLGRTLKVIITAAETSQNFTGSLTSEEKEIPALAPDKPVITVSAGRGQVTVSWEKVADNGSAITGYSLAVKQGDAEITGSPFAIEAAATSYTATGLISGTEYTFILTAANGVGSTASDAKTAVPERTTGGNGSGSGSGGSGSGGGGSSSGGAASSGAAPSAGTTTTDAKKGSVNTLTGIITGTGDGFSKWIPETSQSQTEGTADRWKLQYADGTFADGSYVTDPQGNVVKDAAGNPVEQLHWELINGAWYAFGVDGYAKSGLIFDIALDGWFYVDINTGMKTGWQLIGGKWYYFNPVSDGTKGKMAVSTTIDGYRIDENGVWVQE